MTLASLFATLLALAIAVFAGIAYEDPRLSENQRRLALVAFGVGLLAALLRAAT